MKEYVLDDYQWNKWEYLVLHRVDIHYVTVDGILLACIDYEKLRKENRSEEELRSLSINCEHFCAAASEDIFTCISECRKVSTKNKATCKIISTSISLIVARKVLRMYKYPHWLKVCPFDWR